MKTKTSVWILLIVFTLMLLPGCQAAFAAAPATAQSASSKTEASSLSAAPSPTLQAAPANTPSTPVSGEAAPAVFTPTAPAVQPAGQDEGDKAATAAQAYFTAVSDGKSEEAAKMLSTFSLAVFQITRGDATETLQAQKIAGVRWTDLKILDTQPFDDQTVLVHVTYSETGRVTPTPTATPKTTVKATPAPAQADAAEPVDALWPMRLERGEWRYNWNNVIDFRTLDADAQTTSGITILPTQLTRYSDRIVLSMLIQNRKNEAVVIGQVNETLGTFYFGDQAVIAEKTQWILNPLRAVPAATLEIKGLFTSLPDMVEIRKWNNYDVKPWYAFQLQ